MSTKNQSSIDPNEKANLARHIFEIASKVIVNPDINQLKRHGRPSISFPSEKSLLFIPAGTYEKFEELCQRFLNRNGWPNKFSEEFISETLQPLIANAVEGYTKEQISERIDQITDELNSYSEEQIILIPLNHIMIARGIESISLGNFTLRKMTKNQIKQLETEIQMNTSAVPDPHHKVSRWVEENGIYVQTHIIGEPIRALESAEISFLPYLELLRYIIDSIDERFSNMNFIGGKARYPALTLSSSQYTETMQGANIFHVFNIGRETLDKMNKLKMIELTGIIEKSNKTDFEKAVLRSIHWFANALTQNDIDNRNLSLVIAVETFFNTGGVDKITTVVSEGAAFILGKNLEERKNLKSDFKKFYGLRSAAAHGGNRSSPIAMDQQEIKQKVREFIAEMINFAVKQPCPFKKWQI